MAGGLVLWSTQSISREKCSKLDFPQTCVIQTLIFFVNSGQGLKQTIGYRNGQCGYSITVLNLNLRPRGKGNFNLEIAKLSPSPS